MKQFAVSYDTGRATAFVTSIDTDEERWMSSLQGDFIDRFDSEEEAKSLADEYNNTTAHRKYVTKTELPGTVYPAKPIVETRVIGTRLAFKQNPTDGNVIQGMNPRCYISDLDKHNEPYFIYDQFGWEDGCKPRNVRRIYPPFKINVIKTGDLYTLSIISIECGKVEEIY